MEDFEIINLFLERSEEAIVHTEKKYGKLCASVAGKILRDLRDIEECVSDTWVRIWNSIPPEIPNSLKAYATAIARNLALDRYNYNAADKRSTALTDAFEEIEPCLPGGNGPFEEIEDQGEFKLFLNDFLASLSKENRIIFVKRYWYGYSVGEISTDLQVSESKVKSSLFRTRNKMLNEMEKGGVLL